MNTFCVYCNNSIFSDYLAINNYKYIRCKNCQLVQLLQMPTLKELSKFYNENYYAENYDINNAEHDITIEKHTQIQYEIIKRNFMIEMDTKFLDFGCGIGSFLDTLNANKHQLIYGAELSSIGSEIIKKKGYNYINISEKNEETYDIITLWDVAEHLIDPMDTFRLLYNNLTKGGIMVIGTARIDDFVDKTSFGYTMWADPPAHTILYNKKIFLKILKSAGFNHIWIDNKHSINNIYKSKFKMFKRIIKKIFFYYRTDRKNKQAGFGSYMVVISKK